VAWSFTEPPIVTLVEGLTAVVRPGVALLTVRGSHGEVAPLLLASPLYTAFQLKLPAELNAWDAEFGTTPLVTVTGLPTVVAVPTQVEPVKNS